MPEWGRDRQRDFDTLHARWIKIKTLMVNLLSVAALLLASPPPAALGLERSAAAEPDAPRLVGRPARGPDLDLLVEAGQGGRPGSDAALHRPATFGVGLVALARLADSVRIGSGLGYHRSVATAFLRGSSGGVASEFLLVPGMLTVPVTMKVSLAPSVEAVLEPAVAVGWVGGALYRSGSIRLDFDSRPGLGGQIAAGLELRPLGPLGFSFRAGFRALRPSLVCVRAFVGQGPPQQLARPEPVDVDLSGPFWDLGLSLRL